LIFLANNPIIMRAEQGGLDLARLDSPLRILSVEGHVMAARKSIRFEPYVHPDDPAGYLKPGDTLMAGGYDFSWCYVNYRGVKGCPSYCVGDNGTAWSCIVPGSRPVRIGTAWIRLGDCPSWKGYSRMMVGGVMRYVHQVILETFVGPRPPGMECRHLDGNPGNNRLANLCWGTCKENAADTRRHGRANRIKGEKNSQSKLTEAQVCDVLTLVASGMSRREVARRMGVAHPTINGIVHGRYWRSVTQRIMPEIIGNPISQLSHGPAAETDDDLIGSYDAEVDR
jgi:hypothetical protein